MFPAATFTFLARRGGTNGNVFFDPPRAAEIRNAFANPVESQHDRAQRREARDFFSKIPDWVPESMPLVAISRALRLRRKPESQRIDGLTGALSILLAFSLADTSS